MTQRAKFLTHTIILIAVTLLSACMPEQEDTYKTIQTNEIKKGKNSAKYYLLPGEVTGTPNKTLLVFLDGSSKQSALGRKNENGWESVSLAWFMRKQLPKTIDILVPEKINVDPGENYTDEDEIVAQNTLKNKITLYSAILKNTLPKYERVYLLGYSEGGFMLPKLYKKLAKKEKIRGLILCASGGMSYYDILKLQQKSTQPFSPDYRNSLNALDREIQKIRKNPRSTKHYYFGWPYAKWTEYLAYTPAKTLKDITIPILVIHGDQDLNIPVESSRYLAETFKKARKNNLTYIEIKNTDHSFTNAREEILNEVSRWINPES